jgi:hypothetical protein
MPLEERPDYFGTVDVPAYLADKSHGQILKSVGPSMAAAFHAVQHGFGAAAARGIVTSPPW